MGSAEGILTRCQAPQRADAKLRLRYPAAMALLNSGSGAPIRRDVDRARRIAALVAGSRGKSISAAWGAPRPDRTRRPATSAETRTARSRRAELDDAEGPLGRAPESSAEREVRRRSCSAAALRGEKLVEASPGASGRGAFREREGTRGQRVRAAAPVAVAAFEDCWRRCLRRRLHSRGARAFLRPHPGYHYRRIREIAAWENSA